MTLPIPTCLDQIVTRNRDRFSLGLATEAEIAALTAPVLPGYQRGQIEDWRLIATRQIGEAPILFLLGHNPKEDGAWMTSAVQTISPDLQRLRTRNSIYALGERGAGEPPLEQILHVCYALRTWGLGDILGLAHVFY
jgi:hypothetical protein